MRPTTESQIHVCAKHTYTVVPQECYDYAMSARVYHVSMSLTRLLDLQPSMVVGSKETNTGRHGGQVNAEVRRRCGIDASLFIIGYTGNYVMRTI